MTENGRINQIRKTLGMTLEEFGNKLGVTKVAISNIEKGNRNVTEQMRKAICREFRVDYMWLTTGEGDMFMEADLDDFELIQDIISNQSEFAQNVFKICCKLTEEDWKNIEKVAKNISKYIKEIKEDTKK